MGRNMKNLSRRSHTYALVLIFSMVLTFGGSLRVTPPFNSCGEDAIFGDQRHPFPKKEAKEELGMELYPTGSSLPDCSHACGPCYPCRRVMVSFKCSTESCPIVYRCVCRGKYYHVPSN